MQGYKIIISHSTLLQVYYLKITQQDQPIYIPCKRSGPKSPIETVDILPPTRPISYYLTNYYLYNIIQQSSDILSMSEHYPVQHSTSLWSSINFIAIYSPVFIKPLIFYQFQIIIQPSIQQAYYILSISEKNTAHHSSSLLYSNNFRALSSPEFNKPLICHQFQSNILKTVTLYSDKLQLIFDPFCSKHEAIDPTYNQRSEKNLEWLLSHRNEVVSRTMGSKK